MLCPDLLAGANAVANDFAVFGDILDPRLPGVMHLPRHHMVIPDVVLATFGLGRAFAMNGAGP